MNSKIQNFIKTTKGFMVKHSPEILTGIGVTGMIGSTVLAVKATPKALSIIENKKKELNTDKLTLVETVKVAWKPYIPAVATCVASASCIIGASAVNYKRNAALATAYAISERTLVKYKDKVIETIGEKKEREVKEKIAQDELNQNPISSAQVIITEKGNTLCMDALSGRYFRSDLEMIKKAVNELNREMTFNNYISLDEYYYKINLESIPNGSKLGWNLDGGLLELDYYPGLAKNEEPCIVIDFKVPPKYDFDRLT